MHSSKFSFRFLRHLRKSPKIKLKYRKFITWTEVLCIILGHQPGSTVKINMKLILITFIIIIIIKVIRLLLLPTSLKSNKNCVIFAKLINKSIQLKLACMNNK